MNRREVIVGAGAAAALVKFDVAPVDDGMVGAYLDSRARPQFMPIRDFPHQGRLYFYGDIKNVDDGT